MSEQSTPQWRVEERGAVHLWTIQGAERRNTLTRAMITELGARVGELGQARAPRVVILTGAGEHAFCAGADLKERQGMSPDDVRAFLDAANQTLLEIERSDTVFVAAINGPALGGGLELALACDLRVAAPAAEMGLPEVKLAVIPGVGGTQRLGRMIGMGRAKDLILTGRRVNAAEAFTLGLVNRLAPEGRLLDISWELAESVVQGAPLAVKAAKHAIGDGWSLPLDQALRYEREHYETTLQSEDRLEGLLAFAEKRPARYQGR